MAKPKAQLIKEVNELLEDLYPNDDHPDVSKVCVQRAEIDPEWHSALSTFSDTKRETKYLCNWDLDNKEVTLYEERFVLNTKPFLQELDALKKLVENYTILEIDDGVEFYAMKLQDTTVAELTSMRKHLLKEKENKKARKRCRTVEEQLDDCISRLGTDRALALLKKEASR